MGRMEYSVLKEKVKENECGWSYCVLYILIYIIV
jgi:hypothetical protein